MCNFLCFLLLKLLTMDLPVLSPPHRPSRDCSLHSFCRQPLSIHNKEAGSLESRCWAFNKHLWSLLCMEQSWISKQIHKL